MTENPLHDKRYRAAIRRPVAVAMLFVSIIVFGWKSYQQLPVNLMPNISYPTLTVRTEYEGAAPEDVEKLVSRPIEETLSIVSGLVEISSVSSPGVSEVMLEFTWGTDMNLALQEVRDRLDLFDAPKELTEKPVILRYDPSLDPVMRIAITGSSFDDVADVIERNRLSQQELTTIREAAERYIKSDLEAEIGIAQVAVKGGREREIQIRVDAERLKSLGVSLQDIANSLSQQNINLSGGRLREGKTEYLVRTLNEFLDVEEIRASIITTSVRDQQQLRLADVADVAMGEKDRETVVRINGKETVALDIFKDGDANTVQVCNSLKNLLGFAGELTLSDRIANFAAQAQQSKKTSSTIEKSGALEQLRKAIRSHLPKTAEFTLISDQSRFIKGSIKEAQDAAIQGGLLALLFIMLFLQQWSPTIIIGLAIPISLIATFIPMHMFGITLNVMSLGGLALAVGHLVDDSIIVLESIHRCQEEGDKGWDAIERGVREIFSADVSTTLTNIVVFLPIAFVGGIAGQIFGHFGFTMTFSLLASLLTALYLDPMLTSLKRTQADPGHEVVWMLRAYRGARREGRSTGASIKSVLPSGWRYVMVWLKEVTLTTFGSTGRTFARLKSSPGFKTYLACAGRLVLLPFVVLLYGIQLPIKLLTATLITVFFFLSIVILVVFRLLAILINVMLWLPLKGFNLMFAAVRRTYTHALRVSLRFGPVVLLAAVLLAIHAGYMVQFLGRELIPPLKQGEFGIRMEAPPGTRLEETERLAERIESVVRQNSYVGSVGVEVGLEKASASGGRGENIATFSVVLKNPEKMGRDQDRVIEELRQQISQITSDQVTFTLPTLFSFKTAVELQIRGEDYDELKRVGERALEALRGIPGFKDPELSVKKGYPEIVVALDRDLLASKGISPLQVAQRLRSEVQGDVATRFNQSGEKIDIRVRSDQERLRSIDDLRAISVAGGTPPVSLSSVAHITMQDGPSELRRIDQRPVVMVRGNVEGFDLGSVTTEIEKRLKHVEKPKDYSFVMGGQNRELQTSFGSLQFALLLSIFLVYAVMACQFESFIQPALIMLTVPLGFVGVINVIYWMDIPLSVAVFMGGILLVGIVVNNSMLLIDYANQLRARGRTRREAIYESGQVRFRPVLMTAITTIVGAVPMALNMGEGSELRRPLAITVIAGLTCATVLTLVVIPVIYDMFGGRDKR